MLWQFDHRGYLCGALDPSAPRPARCTEVPPPEGYPEGMVPRWNGAAWRLVRAPA